METILALLSALPKILAIIQLVLAKANDLEQRGFGRKEAIAEALTISHKDMAMADAEEVQAMQSHAKDKTDAAFDQDFKEG